MVRRRALLFRCACLAAASAASLLPAHAQTVPVTIREVTGARVRGLGGAGVALGDDAWRNPAALAAIARPTVRFYGDRAFLLPELQLGAASVSAPLPGIALGASAATFGYEDFRATSFGVGAARSLRFGTYRRLHAGLGVTAHRVAFGGDYGSATGVSLDAGLRTALTPRLDVGARATNLLVGKVGSATLPRHIDVGLAFVATPTVRVVAEAGHLVSAGLSGRGGVEVQVVDALALRVGGGINPEQLATGLTLSLGRIGLDVAVTRSGALPWTPAVELRASL